MGVASEGSSPDRAGGDRLDRRTVPLSLIKDFADFAARVDCIEVSRQIVDGFLLYEGTVLIRVQYYSTNKYLRGILITCCCDF